MTVNCFKLTVLKSYTTIIVIILTPLFSRICKILSMLLTVLILRFLLPRDSYGIERTQVLISASFSKLCRQAGMPTTQSVLSACQKNLL